jgi:hypothetical protein
MEDVGSETIEERCGRIPVQIWRLDTSSCIVYGTSVLNVSIIHQSVTHLGIHLPNSKMILVRILNLVAFSMA